MGNIQELYETRVKPMVPADRLQLARLILDDLAPSKTSVDTLDKGSINVAHIHSPHLAHPEQSKDFAKQVVELAPDARL